MSAELAIQLLGFSLLMTAGLLWIAFDEETVYIFDVFGRSFPVLWYEFRHPWKIILTYAWRLVLLIALIGGASGLACAMALGQWHAGHYVTTTFFLALAFIPLLLLPWIDLAPRFRWHRLICKATKQLAPIALQLADDRGAAIGLSQERINDSWVVWSPNDLDAWPGVYPYANVNASQSIVYFELDAHTYRQNFLAWTKCDHEFVIGSLLPLLGEDLPYRLRQTWPLPQFPNWTLVDLDLLLTEDELNQATA